MNTITKLKTVCLFFVMILTTLSVFAQQYTISGKVVDESGLAIIGATVIQKNEVSRGTTTDVDGAFTLTVSGKDVVLETSFLGYVPNSTVVGASTKNILICLKENLTKLDEVVIVAFAQQKKVSITGAISSISTKDAKQAPVANFATALTGRLPGLSVTQTSGQPGRENVAMFLRGRGTTGNASPLILVDGVPRDDFASIDPNEVESINVLKDASSTAVFGVRGANGVIMVTTRRGDIGRPSLNITMETSMMNYTYRPDRIHSYDYALMINQAEKNDYPDRSEDMLRYTPYMLERYYKQDSPLYPDRDIYKEFVKPFASQSRLNVNMSGGTQDARYFINASYLNQGSMFRTESPRDLGYDPSFSLNRFNFRANVDYKVTRDISLFVNIGGYINNVNFPPNQDNPQYNDPNLTSADMTLWQIYRQRPTTPGPVAPEGWVDDAGRPVPAGAVLTDQFGDNARVYGSLNRSGYVKQTLSTLNSTVGARWALDDLTKGLSTKLLVSYDVNANEFVQGSRDWQFYQVTVPKTAAEADDILVSNIWNSYDADPALRFRRGRGADYKLNLQYSIDYSRTFNEKHSVSGLALFQRDHWVESKSSPLLPFNVVGFSARASYTYDNRYTAEVNAGYNGSEQFAKGKRFGLFPSFSGSWVISNESFFKGANDVVTMMKIRASYGVVGNDKLRGNRFLYLDDMKISGGGLFPSLGRGDYIIQGMVGNPDLTWEKAYKQNYGLDMTLFGDLTISADYYREFRKDILIGRSTIPSFQGTPQNDLPRVNMGQVLNQGIDVELTYQKVFNNDMTLRVTGNFGFNRNRILEADEVPFSTGKGKYAYAYRKTGYPIGQPWGLLIDYDSGAGNGYINTDAELNKYKQMYESYFGSSVRKGDLKYKDLNRDNIIDQRDFAPIGYAYSCPEIAYATNVFFTWKWFDISFMLQGVGHRNSRTAGEEFNGFISGGYQFYAWTEERFKNGEPIKYPALTSNSSNVNTWAKDGGHSEFVLENKAYLRLKNAEIGFTLPQKWVRYIGAKNIRMSVTGQNLFTFDWMRTSFVDPEVENENNYPIMRTINFSLNLTF